MATVILGISAFYHDSAAAVIINGELIAAAQEERFSRIKHDPAFPARAIQYVLQEAGVSYQDLAAVAFYEKPLLKFERLLENYHAFAPKGLLSFITAMPLWFKEKLFMKKLLRGKLQRMGMSHIPLFFPEHHLSHAASAFYPSPFDEAAILTIDGVGEWATTTICRGKSNQIEVLKELHYPHSIGLLYSAFTYYLGFKVNSDEYKLMGLAPYGKADDPQTISFKKKILSELVDIREDGSVLLNMDYFDFATKLRMTNNSRWQHLFGFPRREPESAIHKEHMNLAFAIQEITGSIVLALAQTACRITGMKNLVMAGGVALNCVANAKLLQGNFFDNLWIQPAAGDAGGAPGAAWAVHYIRFHQERRIQNEPDAMKSAYLGPSYSDQTIADTIRNYAASAQYFENFNELSDFVSRKIAEGNVVGWFQGRMEFGPRALGNRSILGDPRNREMQRIMNAKIKFREGFRPFAPAVLQEEFSHYFQTEIPSPYMLLVASLREAFRKDCPEDEGHRTLTEQLMQVRSEFPAITHVDYSARLQTVTGTANPRFWQLIQDYKKITGCPMLINTSFNIRGEPIVCSPKDAYLSFMRTGMDYLVMGNYLLDKRKQSGKVNAG